MRLLLVLLSSLVLQSTPGAVDFSGTWKMIPEKSGSPEQSAPITEMTFVIAQTANDIRLEMTSGHDKPISVTYPLGPAPRVPEDALPSGQQRAFWQGNRLTVERGITISGQTVSSKQMLTLNPDRSEMTVERLVIVQHGYTLKGTPNYATVTDVFARVPR
ncbi:MAG: hypothetical protein ABI983_05070 [Acidobacteriota bacterium]